MFNNLCKWGHKWSKWGEPEEYVKSTLDAPVAVQKRTCERCNRISYAYVAIHREFSNV